MGSKKGAESWWEKVGKEREKWDWKRLGKGAEISVRKGAKMG